MDKIRFDKFKKLNFNFDHINIRKIEFKSSLVFTTHNQFFESFYSNNPMKLSKIKNYANSVVIIDEYHTFPIRLCKEIDRAISYMSKQQNVKFILCSGTPNAKHMLVKSKPQNICSVEFNEKMDENEIKRVRRDYDDIVQDKKTNYEELSEKVLENQKKGSVLVVFNTISNACKFYKTLEHQGHQDKIEYLGNSLSHKDVKKNLKKIKKRIQDKDNIILIATPIVEMGMDLSLRYGYREISSCDSIRQLIGRICRNSEYNDSFLKVFELEEDIRNDNPSISKEIDFFRKKCKDGVDDFIRKKSHELSHEYKIHVGEDQYEENQLDLTKGVGINHEKALNFETIADGIRNPQKGESKYKDAFKFITTNQSGVVVGSEFIEKIMNNDKKISFQEIEENSVQMFGAKIEKFIKSGLIKTLSDEEDTDQKENGEFLIWTGKYSPSSIGYYEELIGEIY